MSSLSILHKTLLGRFPLGAASSKTITKRSTRPMSWAAENQINAWLRQGGDEVVKSGKGKKLDSDRHRHMANSLGVGHDYLHSKILKDNNIKPLSIQRRQELDEGWEKLQAEIRSSFDASGKSLEEFVASDGKQQFARSIQELDVQAKKVNEAVISDSLRFNGRSPVPHARRFHLEERIREAIEGTNK